MVRPTRERDGIQLARAAAVVTNGLTSRSESVDPPVLSGGSGVAATGRQRNRPRSSLRSVALLRETSVISAEARRGKRGDFTRSASINARLTLRPRPCRLTGDARSDRPITTTPAAKTASSKCRSRAATIAGVPMARAPGRQIGCHGAVERSRSQHGAHRIGRSIGVRSGAATPATAGKTLSSQRPNPLSRAVWQSRERGTSISSGA
jgi:hypothetical protein